MKNPINNNQISMFASTYEKGSSEWSSFNGVRDDRAGGYRVAAPQKRTVPTPGIIEITRFPRPFSPNPAQ